jgi:hypothetical protein
MSKEFNEAESKLISNLMFKLSDPAHLEDMKKLCIECGFKQTPSNEELITWAVDLMTEWLSPIPDKMSLPIVGFTIAYNKVVNNKLSVLDMVHLKTLLSAAYSMGFKMAKLNITNPFLNLESN